MFDRFSMQARRAVFWARHEAGRSGSQAIDSEHLLLGLLMEDQDESEQYAVSRFGDKTRIICERGDPYGPFFSNEAAGRLRQTLSEQTRPGAPVADTVDMPLTEAAALALMAAKEHAGNAEVQLLYILWGLISDETSSVRDLLNVNGVTVERVEDAIRRRPGS